MDATFPRSVCSIHHQVLYVIDMRLLNAKTLALHSFIDDSHVPKYAILSHTWKSEEVTFEQIRKTAHEELKHKAGFKKIQLAAKQALQDGYYYIWIDTCCIDKSSSSELSESINSMFKWYKMAGICYAYLDDVDVHANRPEPWVDSSGLQREYVEEEELAKAKWFTRGWTLQELLAPDKLRFYVKGWTYVGDKSYLEPKISRITGITIDALDSGNELGSYSVAMRMSWASKRRTTRAEDMAYCLLGLFDVNMPLLYGEGGEKAFTRLQQEILEDSSDCSVFAWVNVIEAPQPSWKSDVAQRLLTNDSGGRSIFAHNPREFHLSGRIRSSHTGEILVTSVGVKVELPIFSLPHLSTKMTDAEGKVTANQDLFVVLLYWIHSDEGKQPGGIDWTQEGHSTEENTGLVVRRCHKGELGAPDMFLRHEGYGLIRDPGIVLKKEDFRPMYLCKKVPDSNMRRRLRINRFESEAREPRVYPKFVGLPKGVFEYLFTPE